VVSRRWRYSPDDEQPDADDRHCTVGRFRNPRLMLEPCRSAASGGSRTEQK
jgi:hypothetical protein